MISNHLLRLSPIVLATFLTACGGSSSSPPPVASDEDIDLRDVSPADGLLRLYGSSGNGRFGVPVAGGFDVDGDGHLDFAMASMLASPESRTNAGQVVLTFGDSNLDYEIDTAESNANVLTIIGDGALEMTGSEIWMGDVTGDGLGDLLIARQNYSTNTRIGAGALTVIVGSSELSALAAAGTTFDLRDPPSTVNVFTFIGAGSLDRLGIWVRAGDITGDGIDDLAIGADQEDAQGTNSGAVYVVRGGSHINTNATIDLADIAGSTLAGHIATVLPPADSNNYHLGATLNIADLDGNGTSELMMGATLNRAGAGIEADGAPPNSANAQGGSPNGRLYIVWDDNFPATWADDFTIVTDGTGAGGITDISGAETSLFDNNFFGEEMVGGLDYNGDDLPDAFIGDISGDTTRFSSAGLGFVFFDSAQLKNQTFDMANIPSGLDVTTLLGTRSGAISSDTALHGDFDGDGIDDLAVSSPHDAALQRTDSGTLHVLWGQSEWPATIDLSEGSQPDTAVFDVTNIYGANGTRGTDKGDTLAYSAASADMDGDGQIDLIVNEMVGNGTSASAQDVGNLIILSGTLVSSSR